MADVDIMSPPSLDGSATKAVAMSTEIMIITVVVLCFVMAFCLFIHIYSKCYWISYAEDPNVVSWRRRIARGRPQPPAEAQRRGLDPAALQALPVVVYDPNNFKEGLECAVCLSELSEGEKARLLPKCNHGFHVECIDMWFKSHSTCPLCRNSVINSDDISNSSSSRSNVNINDDGLYASDSSSESDNDDHGSYDGDDDSPRVVESSAVFPTNVLVWGDEAQIRSFGVMNNDVSSAAASSSSGVNRPRNCDEMVIDIPASGHELCEDCSPTQEQAKTPVVSRLGSLRRWLSLGKRVAVTPSPRGGSSSCEDQQV